MNTLHGVVYQIVSNPNLLTEIAQNGQVLFEGFNLAPAEAQTLLNIIQDTDTLSRFLSSDYIPQPMLDQAWIP